MLRGLNHITLAVTDLDRSLDFYSQVLGMKAHVRWDKGAYLSLGDLWICLSCDEAQPGQDYSHIALDIAEGDFHAFAEKLRAAQVAEWKQNRSEGLSIYFLDPDGHKLEVHSGDLRSRLEAIQRGPYSGLLWL